MPQGTIKDFDPVEHTGTLLDDGLRLHRFDREAFRASGLRELRIGQRIRFELDEGSDPATITHLNIISL